jgi:hypothetical protein
MLRIERQEMLNALNCICNYHSYKTEEEHGDRILGPAHFVRLIDAAYLVEEAFDGAEKDVGEGAFALEDPGHVSAEGLRADEHEGEEEEDLKPAVGGHWASILLELFWLKKSVDEVDEEGGRDEAKQKNLHSYLLPFEPSRSHPVA